MTNHYTDIGNADAILIMGSNAAEHHPIAFRWVLKAKEKGAVVIHVDPKFSRTSARSSFHVPLRSGTDIAFLGGMVQVHPGQQEVLRRLRAGLHQRELPGGREVLLQGRPVLRLRPGQEEVRQERLGLREGRQGPGQARQDAPASPMRHQRAEEPLRALQPGPSCPR